MDAIRLLRTEKGLIAMYHSQTSRYKDKFAVQILDSEKKEIGRHTFTAYHRANKWYNKQVEKLIGA